MTLSRRKLLKAWGLALVAGLALVKPARAAPTTLTYSVNYAGDFTSINTAVTTTSLGTDFTASSTGKVSVAGSTSTTFAFALTETADFTGHPVTAGGETHLIGSYNNTTKIGTLVARAGYAGTWTSTPGAAVSYTVADVTVILNIGQSAANNNLWTIGSTITIGSITTDATHTLTLQSATAWNPAAKLGFNASGVITQAVGLYTNSTNPMMNGNVDYVFLRGLGFKEESSQSIVNPYNNGAWSADSCVFEQASGDNGYQFAFQVKGGLGSYVKNCVFTAPQGPSSTKVGIAAVNSSMQVYGCSFWGNIQPLAYHGGLTACVALNNRTLDNSLTYTNVLTDTASPPSGCTVIATYGQYVSAANDGDFRALSTGALPNSVLFNVNLTVDIYGTARPGSGNITAGADQTPYVQPTPQTITWSIAYNGDAQLVAGTYTTLSNLMGPDLTYFSQGLTCPSTAANSSHIVVDSTETAASIVGHVIRDNTLGVSCLATSYSGNIIAVSAKAGYPANFGSTPQSGDSYTVYPTLLADFAIGASASGHTIWDLSFNVGGANTYAIRLTTVTDGAHTVQVRGTGTRVKGRDVPGTWVDGTGPIMIQVLSTDHLGIFQLDCDFVRFSNIDTYMPNANDLDSNIFLTVPIPNSSVNNVVWMGGQWAFVGNHLPFNVSQITFNNSVLITSTPHLYNAFKNGCTLNYCSVLCTKNLIATATAGASSGQPVLTLDPTSIAAINALVSQDSYFAGHPSIPAGTGVLSVNVGANQVTLNANLTGNISNGATIYFGSNSLYNNSGGGADSVMTLNNTAVFGFVNPVVESNATPVFTNCATDTPSGQTGFTTLSYPAQFVAASGVGDGSVNATPKAGNGLQIGTYSASYPTDLFGAARANPCTIGAVEFAAAASGGAGIIGGGVGGSIIGG